MIWVQSLENETVVHHNVEAGRGRATMSECERYVTVNVGTGAVFSHGAMLVDTGRSGSERRPDAAASRNVYSDVGPELCTRHK